METTSSLANTSNSAILRDIETIRKYVKESTRQGEKEQDIVLNCPVTRDPHDRLQFWKAIAFLEKSWLRFLGIEAILSMYGNDYQTTYNFAARWSLHSLLGLKLVCCDVRLRRFPIAGLRLSFIAGGLTVRNVVPTDSAIMTACKTGDITSVKQLFRTRQASPNDVTPENSSPLRVSSVLDICFIKVLTSIVCNRERIDRAGAGDPYFWSRYQCSLWTIHDVSKARILYKNSG